MHEHPHEHTQYYIPDKDDVKIDPNFTNILKNIRDEIGSLNANIKNINESNNKLSLALHGLTFFGVCVATFGTSVALIQFLFENKIWPFIQ